MRRIPLKSRYGDAYWLVEIEHNSYAVRDARWVRFGGDDARNLEFLDLPGGPFMARGTVLQATDGGRLQIERITITTLTDDQIELRVWMKAVDDNDNGSGTTAD